jgi:hypothetical protein
MGRVGEPSRYVRVRSLSGTLLLAVAIAAEGCQHRPVADPAAARPSERLFVRLPDLGGLKRRSLTVWIARPRGAPARPLVLHLTGDSGRHGLDLLLFTAVSQWGYPVVVVGSPDWIEVLIGGWTTRESLARDLDVVARAAARATGVPESEPVVLLGLSRGAGLVVEAAGAAPLRDRLRGVIALGLCPREDWVRGNDGAGRPYRDKALLAGLPLEVIQSTHDRYLSAAEARKAFGPDTGQQAFHPIEASSHTFIGGREALLPRLRLSLDRVAGR